MDSKSNTDKAKGEKFTFGDIVVVDGENIGVVVKSWIGVRNAENNHDVYVRMANTIINYKASEMERYLVRHKFLSDEEKDYQYNALNDL